jgi:hypothetical protein
VLAPDALELCFEPQGGPVCPTGGAAHRIDALLIAFLGATGGAITAVVAITRMQGTQTPFGVPLSLAVLKLPFGAITALVGLLLIHGEFVPGLTNLDTEGQILAYALFFGIAQQIVTGFVDRQAANLLNKIPYKREPDTEQAPSSQQLADLAAFMADAQRDARNREAVGADAQAVGETK